MDCRERTGTRVDARRRTPVGLDRIVASAAAAGMTPGFEISLPSGKKGVYTAAIFPDDIAKQRTIHFDQYSGKPIR